MSDLDELKLKYTEENPDKPSDDVETIAFHSTPRKPKPAPKAVGPKRAKAEPPRKAVPLTMGVPRGVPTPNEASAALWLAALALAVVLAATRAAAVVPFLAIAVILALGALMHPVTAPVLHDMERRFGLTVVDVSAGGHVRFVDSEGRLREGILRVYGRRATMFDGNGSILSA